MPTQPEYSEEEAREILRIANERNVLEGRMTRDQILQSATELGISPAEIDAAEATLLARKTDEVQRAAYREHIRSHLMSMVSSWLGTSVLLIGINFLTGFRSFWSVWPIGIWGLVVLKDVLEFTLSQPWKSEARFQKWKLKQEDKED